MKKKPTSRPEKQGGVSISDWNSHLAGCDVIVNLEELVVGINKQCDEGFTPLHWATCNGQLEDVKKLLEAGPDISIRSNEWNTALHSAIKPKIVKPNNQVEILRLYQKNDPQVDATDRNGGTPLI